MSKVIYRQIRPNEQLISFRGIGHVFYGFFLRFYQIFVVPWPRLDLNCDMLPKEFNVNLSTALSGQLKAVKTLKLFFGI